MLQLGSPARHLLDSRRLSARFAAHAGFIVATASAAVFALYSFPGVAGVFGCVLAMLMGLVAFIDRQHLIIPDWLNVTAGTIGLSQCLFFELDRGMVEGLELSLLRGGALALAFFTVRWLYHVFRGREGLGLGDVKLAFVAGVWLDWWALPVSVEIAALSALAKYICGSFFGQSDPSARMPFGLFFGPSIWIAWIIQASVAGH
jgi:leader peptidase (prepilin peptidase)/N-methyltransferase